MVHRSVLAVQSPPASGQGGRGGAEGRYPSQKAPPKRHCMSGELGTAAWGRLPANLALRLADGSVSHGPPSKAQRSAYQRVPGPPRPRPMPPASWQLAQSHMRCLSKPGEKVALPLFTRHARRWQRTGRQEAGEAQGRGPQVLPLRRQQPPCEPACCCWHRLLASDVSKQGHSCLAGAHYPRPSSGCIHVPPASTPPSCSDSAGQVH